MNTPTKTTGTRKDFDRFLKFNKKTAILILSQSMASPTLTKADKCGMLLLGFSHGHNDVRRQARFQSTKICDDFFASFLHQDGKIGQLNFDVYTEKLDNLEKFFASGEEQPAATETPPKKRAVKAKPMDKEGTANPVPKKRTRLAKGPTSIEAPMLG